MKKQISKLKEFWNSHQEKLNDYYPGVSFHYIEDVFNQSHLELDVFFSQLLAAKPLDYISQNRNFVGIDFYVDSRVLIPRFETELLYEMALDKIKNTLDSNARICEVGVGSGCLGLSLLASLPDLSLNFDAIDICSNALDVFKLNQRKLAREITHHQVNIIESDRLEAVCEYKYDLIISNPPYIKTREDKKLVHQTTLDNEPHKALFIDDDEYDDWFDRLFSQVFNCLNENAYFMMEGHENHLQNQASTERNHSDRCWSYVEVVKDLTKRDRFLILKK